MTEKQYGGASKHGFSGKIDNKISNSDFVLKINEKNNLNIDFQDNLDEETIESYKKAGKIVQEVRKFTEKIVKKDVLLIEIADKIEKKILDLGGDCAFPVNTSIDEIAAHYTPVVNDETKATGLLKIDFGVSVNGFIADNAMSFDLTENNEFQDMINLNELALKEVLDSLEFGDTISKIGNKVSEIVKKDGRFRIIHNLSGHSLAEDEIHAGLTIPNHENENSTELSEIAIAIEPFLTTGKGEIYEGKPSDIFMLQNTERQPRERDARKLLEFIKSEFSTRPFCKRWLNESKDLKGISWRFGLTSLVREGIVYNFPVLVEKDKKPVSQAEHSIIFYQGKRLVYTRD